MISDVLNTEVSEVEKEIQNTKDSKERSCKIKHDKPDFDVLLTVHFSIFILAINQLDTQHFCFTISLFRSLYMFRAHVLIIGRSKLHYAASGIITPIGGLLVHRLREDPRLCNAILPPDDEHMCSKHVEATK